MIIIWLVALLATVVLVAAAAYDLVLTRRCIVAGVAVEGNTWLVGRKPSAKVLWLRELLQSGPLVLGCIIAAAMDSWGFILIVVVAMLVFALKHYLAGRKGAKFLDH